MNDPNKQMGYAPLKRSATDWAREMLSLPPGKVLILDTETCALHGEIIELAIIDSAGAEIYNRRFSPLTAIDAGAQRIHGITREMLRGEPFFASEYPQIRAILDAAHVVLIYNNQFDLGCLAVTCNLHSVAELTFHSACIMRWHAQWYGEWSRGSYKWQKLTGGDHSALGDARAALALLRKMAQEEQTQ